MAMLFAAAGGLISAQDEAVAAALSKAAAEPAGLQSVGLIHGNASDLINTDEKCVMGGYGRVGPEDVSSSPLERIASCAEALQPQQYMDIQTKAATVADGLSNAAHTLQGELDAVLGHGWQGEFAVNAQASTRALVESAHSLSDELKQVADKASRAHDGLATTQTNIAEYAHQGALAKSQAEMRSFEQGPGIGDAGAGVGAALAEAEARAAEEQARAIVNTTYSPAVMDANLDDLDFTAAHRVVSGAGLGGPAGIDMVRVWNTDGIPTTSPAATPNSAALAAYSGATADLGAGPGGVGATAAGVGAGGATASASPIATDAATEQALLASRNGDGAAGMAALPGQAGGGAGAGAGAGAGVNAATSLAGAPLAPMAGAPGQFGAAGGSGTAGISGQRGSDQSNRDRDRGRGYGSAAGLVGGGGAAAAGAGAARMGGAGTLSGLGGSAGPGGTAGNAGNGTIAGPPRMGAGTGPGVTAGAGGMGASSSSSPGGSTAARAGGVPMGGMMGAANAAQGSERRGHTPAGYLTNATNTTDIVGEPVKVAPAVLGRKSAVESSAEESTAAASESGVGTAPGRVLGRSYTGSGK